MTIEILPAQLANQIAAGEVVERPASVVKELVENSLDAGATAIKIDIEKGGAKRIRISDNGSGIAKNELTLALSRHATSKIKVLNDLEGIASLGFRGEALASISSVARLSLTSKPAKQTEAWQAHAEGRDMDVVVQPAAHGNGTTIDVVDLFFNTPARRKFLRTEKTEFAHIEEVIKRIALARFDVAITLTHNHKVIKQYRLADSDTKRSKRVAQVCGQAFIDHAVEINCQHNGLSLMGWLAKPSFYRGQNDLCYSYVNGRMMRDKLINHAIRQAYQDLLPNDAYPAFVLFLSLDVREVDVNVHPAKHEVRFHQGRYIHDFIYATCHRTLTSQKTLLPDEETDNTSYYQANDAESAVAHATEKVQEYVAPLKRSSNTTGTSSRGVTPFDPHRASITDSAVQNYHRLMTPIAEPESTKIASSDLAKWHFIAPHYVLILESTQQLTLFCLKSLTRQLMREKIAQQWQKGITSQPLLLPIKLAADAAHQELICQYEEQLVRLGIVVKLLDSKNIQLRQFPAILRNVDVSACYHQLMTKLLTRDLTEDSVWQDVLADVATPAEFSAESMLSVLNELQHFYPDKNKQQQVLKSTLVDLTSAIQKLQ